MNRPPLPSPPALEEALKFLKARYPEAEFRGDEVVLHPRVRGSIKGLAVRIDNYGPDAPQDYAEVLDYWLREERRKDAYAGMVEVLTLS